MRRVEMKNSRFRASIVKAAGLALALLIAAPIGFGAPAWAEGENPVLFGKKKKKAEENAASWKGSQTGGKATTATEIVANDARGPMLSAEGAARLNAALAKYQEIVDSGGWPKVSGAKLKKGAEGKGVAALNQRLYREGYVRAEAAQGEFAQIFTSATEDGVKRFQRNHGLAVTGVADTATLNQLNVPASQRLSAIRANIARMEDYSKDLGNRYIIVNIPAQQIEAVNDGRVYSRHNAIVGRPSRPTPVVVTALSDIKFNPYWNAPASIVERDIIPRMLSSGSSKVMEEMRMKVFDGVGGPEINPDSVNWRRAVPDNYHFRQEPGGDNAMATAKINFPSPFGIYLHDTPEKQLFASGSRFYSSGCVRVEKVAILLNWILNGQDGINSGRIGELAGTEERLDVNLVNPPQLRVTYLTAWTNKEGEVNFRPDIYELDGTGFVVGQPLPVGETSGGQRYVLKPVPRQLASVDADEADGFFWFGSRVNSKAKSVAASVKKSAISAKKAGASSFARLMQGRDGDGGPTWTENLTNPLKKKPVKKTAKKDPKKDADKKKLAAAKKDGSAAKKTAATKTPVKKKIASSDEQTAAVKKVEPPKKPATAKKPVEACKPGKDGKPVKDCKPVAEAKKVPDKTVAAAN